MSRTSDATRSVDLDSLPSWISDHLGEGSSFMTDEVNQSPSSPMEGSPEESPMIAIHPSVRLPDEGEIITSTRPGEVAFYEAAFPAGLRFSLHPTIRLILQFYNICSAQLVPNAWRSIACSMALWWVYKYSISLSEFRNLFSLNSNPKPDQGWLYFKARNKKVLLGGYPSNVKGWKSKVFFVSSDEWEIPEGTPRVGVPRVPRTWGISGRSLLSFYPVFVLLNAQASRTEGDNLPSREAPSSSSDVGEFQNPHEQARRESPSRDDSIECLRSIRTELRRLLPHIPDLTLLRWTGGKVLDPILDYFLNALSSNPSSESCSDLSLPVELESDAMSKRLALRRSARLSGRRRVRARGLLLRRSGQERASRARPARRERTTTARKEKGLIAGPKSKRRRLCRAKPQPLQPPLQTAAPSHPEEGTSAHLADKEKVDKLTLDQTATKLFHVIVQVLVLGSSLAVRSREAGEQASLQEGRVASMETEVARLQKFAADLEQQLAESRACEQQANDELAKMKSDRDSLADKLERSGVLVNELRGPWTKPRSLPWRSSNPRRSSWWQLKTLYPNTLARGLTSARCNFGGIIPTSLSILRAPWSIKIC
ncbi:hypothetical protein Acr_05g0012850 [Actinidia rufa]|uniref:Uncharacterized protein n=1 Tax=Actinidia rufa TaxID=165716 RepID=A0A7J0ENA4_9ERIC|nr:hypothetical protein Acr_05g0012850 [Actinidia rufa]